MDKDQIRLWEERVFDALDAVSDNEYQNSVWLGLDLSKFSSFGEVYCVLFDDCDFENYMKYYLAIKGEDKLYILFTELVKMMRDYKSPGRDNLVLRDPSWIMVTDKAKEILPLLSFTT